MSIGGETLIVLLLELRDEKVDEAITEGLADKGIITGNGVDFRDARK